MVRRNMLKAFSSLTASKFCESFNMRRGHFIKAMYSSLVDGIITDPELMVRQIAIGMPRTHHKSSRAWDGNLEKALARRSCLVSETRLKLKALPIDDHAIIRNLGSSERIRGVRQGLDFAQMPARHSQQLRLRV